jgi:hypothetical protein
MPKKVSYQYLTQTATKPAKSWTARDLATFHAFNPNGATAIKRATDELVSEMVDAKLITSGHLYTIGSLSDLYNEEPRLSQIAIGEARASKFAISRRARNMLDLAAQAEALYAQKVTKAAA